MLETSGKNECLVCKGKSGYVNWMLCETCKRCFHQECAGVKDPVNHSIVGVCWECGRPDKNETFGTPDFHSTLATQTPANEDLSMQEIVSRLKELRAAAGKIKMNPDLFDSVQSELQELTQAFSNEENETVVQVESEEETMVLEPIQRTTPEEKMKQYKRMGAIPKQPAPGVKQKSLVSQRATRIPEAVGDAGIGGYQFSLENLEVKKPKTQPKPEKTGKSPPDLTRVNHQKDRTDTNNRNRGKQDYDSDSSEEEQPKTQLKPEKTEKSPQYRTRVNHQRDSSDKNSGNRRKQNYDSDSSEEYRGNHRASDYHRQEEDDRSSFLELITLMKREQIPPLTEFYGDGDEDTWPSFLMEFRQTNEEGKFTARQIMKRLKDSLQGKAKELVKGKLSEPKNVESVIELLNDVYGNSARIITKWITKMKSMPAPDMDNPAAVMVFRTELSNGLDYLKAVEAKSYLNCPTIATDLVQKLPIRTRREWRKHVNEKLNVLHGAATLEQFVNWFVKHTRWVLEEIEIGKPRTLRRERNAQFNLHQEEDNRHNQDRKSNACKFCEKAEHELTKCSKFVNGSLKARWEFAKKKRLCFCCLKEMHQSECPEKKACGENGCDKFHHKLLHKIETEERKKEEKPILNATMNCHNNESTFFRIVPIKLFANGKVVEANAFFDEGSAPSMLTMELAQELGLSGTNEPLCLSWTDNRIKRVKNSERVSLTVSGVEENAESICLRNVRTIPRAALDLPKSSRDILQLQDQYPYLKDIKIPQPFDKKPDLLIGLEHAKLGLAKQTREGTWNEPVASRTSLGWVIHGKQKFTTTPIIQRNFVVCECDHENQIHQLIENFFSTEAFGVNAVKKREAEDDKRAMEILEKSTKDLGGRFETGLLWKRNDSTLPDNKTMAMKRLLCFEKQLMRDKNLKEAVQKRIQENIENGFWKKMTNEAATKVGPRTWYLPIFVVTNPHKPGKIRLVYDAAAKVNDISLNSELLPGPDMLKSIAGVLWRARVGKVAVSGDIKDMFHRVLICQPDQDSQRILWRDCDTNREPDTYILSVMSFGATSSPCSAQWVKNQNALRFADTHPRAVQSIVENHYVDDMFDSFEDETEAVKTSKAVIEIHEKGGFVIRNWISNSENVMTQLNGKPATSDAILSLDMKDDNIDKILGFYWDAKKDIFTFRLNFKRIDQKILLATRVPTKREVLRLVMAVFDPHGYTSPVLVHGKILLQSIWRQEIDWDQQLSVDLYQQFVHWLEDLKLIEKVAIPRCFSHTLKMADRVEIHCFVDASEFAFAAVCYLRVKSADKIEVSMIGSKNKVAPRKQLSIPKLELQACVLGTRLVTTIQKELPLKIDEKYFWSDSQTALAWISSDHRRYSQFVGNRVSEILDSTKMKNWRWISTRKNVADEATKRPKEINLSPSGRWMSGPNFLKLEEQEWEKSDFSCIPCEEELRSRFAGITKELKSQYNTIQDQRFSNWNRLVRVCGWILRVRNLCRGAHNKKLPRTLPLTGTTYEKIPPLTASELKEAEGLLVKKVQWEAFADEISQLSNGEPIKKDNKLIPLSPFLDNDGVLRMKGRLDATPYITVDLKQPMILDKDHHITKLLVMAFHNRFHHQNTETVVNEMRQRFWVVGLRTLVKSTVKGCQKCKNAKVVPVVPEMSPLPPARLAIHEFPFTYTGVDYFGPILITIGRRHEKRYGVVFTCLTTRAVHVELASTLETSSCIMAVRNFMCRRGPPKQIWSDNGTNLRGAEAELRIAVESLNFHRLQAEGQWNMPGFTVTQWFFITPRAPHMGGAWEVHVRLLKKVIYACLKEKAPKEEVLRNFLIEAESIVNSRPLTYMPIEPDTLEAITPNHILRMAGKTVYAPVKVDEKVCTKPWRYAQKIADEFWRRFVLEYLPDLTKRTKWYTDQKHIEIGDVVILIEENAERNQWEKGIVEKLHPGPDGKVRTVSVRVAGKTKKRPVAKLAILDVRKKEL